MTSNNWTPQAGRFDKNPRLISAVPALPTLATTREKTSELDVQLTERLVKMCLTDTGYVCYLCGYVAKDRDDITEHLAEDINARFKAVAEAFAKTPDTRPFDRKPTQ